MGTDGVPDPIGAAEAVAEQLPGDADGTPVAPNAGDAPTAWAKPRKHGRMDCILTGALIMFVAGSLLYGPANVVQGLVFATICTAGIGLVLILLVCWMIGWVALEVWDGLKGRKVAGTP